MGRTTTLTLEERYEKQKQQKHNWYVKNKKKVRDCTKAYRCKKSIEKAQNIIYRNRYSLVVLSLEKRPLND